MEINEGDIVLLDSVLLPELDYPHRHMFEGGIYKVTYIRPANHCKYPLGWVRLKSIFSPNLKEGTTYGFTLSCIILIKLNEGWGDG